MARALVAALPTLALASGAAAQGTGPRSAQLDTVSSPMIGYAIVVVLGLAILAISLYPSKRSHTDI